MKKIYITLCVIILGGVFAPTHIYAQGGLVKVVKECAPTLSSQATHTLAEQCLKGITMESVPVATAPSVAKKILIQAEAYQAEIQQARESLDQLIRAKQEGLPIKEFRERVPAFEEQFIVNNSLNRFVKAALEKGDYTQAIKEIEQYYNITSSLNSTLSEGHSFSITAIDYLRRHPRKINLPLRIVLRSSFIDPDLKNQITKIVGKMELSAHDQKQLGSLLPEVYRQYTTKMEMLAKSDDIVATIQTYKEAIAALETFLKETGRFPIERGVLGEIRLAQFVNKLLDEPATLNQFSMVRPLIEKIRRLKETHPTEILELAEFERQFRDFVNREKAVAMYAAAPCFDYSSKDYMLAISYEYYSATDFDTFQKIVVPIVLPLYPPGTVK